MQLPAACTMVPTAATGAPNLRVFEREIDLDQHLDRPARLAGGLVDALQQVDAVDRVNRVSGAGGLSGLVRLQVADQMPLQRVIGRLGNFLQGFLHLVFAEIALPGVGGGTNGVDGMGLGDGDQPDVIR